LKNLLTSLVLLFLVHIPLASVCVAADVTPKSVTLYWTAPGDDGQSGRAFRYDLRYSTTSFSKYNWQYAAEATTEPPPGHPGMVQSCTITGLQPNTTYYFAIKTVNEANNWSELSNIFKVTLPDTSKSPTDIDDPDTSLTAFNQRLLLRQNYPNPFNLNTVISYRLPRSMHVSLKIFNILGQPVAELVNFVQEAGEYSIRWNGNSLRGKPVASGIYIYSLITPEAVEQKKMIVVK